MASQYAAQGDEVQENLEVAGQVSDQLALSASMDLSRGKATVASPSFADTNASLVPRPSVGTSAQDSFLNPTNLPLLQEFEAVAMVGQSDC